MYSDVSKKVMMLIREISLHFTHRERMYTYMSRRMNGEGRKTEMIEIEVHEKLNRFNFRPTFPIFGQLCQFRDVSTFYNSGLKSERERERESSFVLSVTTIRFYFSSEILIPYCRILLISMNVES